MSIDAVRAVADAVLYEGYLLYPYRAGATKNRSRWQFGVLGPPRAAAGAFAEEPTMSAQCLLSPSTTGVRVYLRFLQLQGDAAVAHEIELPTVELPTVELPAVVTLPARVPGGRLRAAEQAGNAGQAGAAGRRWPLTAGVRISGERLGGWIRLTVEVTNECPDEVADKDAAMRRSLLAAHLVLVAEGGRFVSAQDPPTGAPECRQHRCWPVLAGDGDVMLAAPIILYDHPRIAEESPGDLFDSTEIDEILTLRVMTMTDAEKAEARATDPRAAEIVDRCDALTPADLERLHGVLRPADPERRPGLPRPAGREPGAPGPAHPAGPEPGDLVRVRPRRRADAQDMFFAGRVGRIAAVLDDVDGSTHVALTLLDDPAADLHEWYGRYLYFSPDELEPL
ncbi:hypothetical protein [Paractinoplanes atraurantiacus]|uniref:Uncharacterized protein n=1 Tax=Paractinoplanes atraurantiacus TaxID=1036182 RepID=A0A285J406_9ACTN|nr:hypothetical protein [Actinoplanes atraurantiacus]SNY54793.1 hypothetical protein SAMN05421748_115159 [Actinoplanes atraurantiacus]